MPRAHGLDLRRLTCNVLDKIEYLAKKIRCRANFAAEIPLVPHRLCENKILILLVRRVNEFLC